MESLRGGEPFLIPPTSLLGWFTTTGGGGGRGSLQRYCTIICSDITNTFITSYFQVSIL